MPANITDFEAAWEYVIARCTIDDSITLPEDINGERSPCWIWFNVRKDGYGYAWHDGKPVRAHCFVYALAHDGVFVVSPLQLNHQCHNKRCVNPSHLMPGTQSDNGKQNAGRMPKGEDCLIAKLTEVDVEEMRILAAEGVAFAKIGRRKGVKNNAVKQACLGITWNHVPFLPGQLDRIKAHLAGRNKKYSDDKIRRAVELIAAGKTFTQICDLEGYCGPTQISQFLARACQRDVGVEPKVLGRALELTKRRNLRRSAGAEEDDLVNEVMKQASETNDNFKTIGNRVGISENSVQRIVRGEIWKDVPRDPAQKAEALRRAHDRRVRNEVATRQGISYA
jgi:hypothetical protein